MDQRVKELWLKALRSGEYDQSTHQLKTVTMDGFGYCCLGVLCDLYIKDTGNGKWDYVGLNGWIVDDDEAGSLSSDVELIPTVAQWAGLSSDPTLPFTFQMLNGEPGNREFTYLASLNDNGCTFSQMADLIEHLV